MNYKMTGLGLLAGAGLGLAIGLAQPKLYEARTSLHFRSVNQVLFEKLLESLQSDEPSNALLGQLSGTEDDDSKAQLAKEILQTRAALHFARRQAGLSTDSESIERFRRSSMEIELRPGGIVEVVVWDPRPQMASKICQELLSYYDQFLKQQSLSASGQLRTALQARYEKLRTQLRKLERRLGKDSPQRTKLSEQGLSSLTITEIEQLQQENLDKSARVASRLHKIRKDLAGPDALTQALQKERPSPRTYDQLPPPGKAGLVDRVRLERNYEDSVALHRMLMVQLGVVRLFEELERSDYEVIDPLQVSSFDNSRRVALWMFVGGLVGTVLALGVNGYRASQDSMPPNQLQA